MMKSVYKGLTVLLLCLALFCFSSCAVRYETHRSYAMGSYVAVTVPVGTEISPSLSGLAALENEISHRIDGSAVARLNAGECCSPSDRLLRVLCLAEEIGQKTEGRFSIFCLPQTKLWNFDAEHFAPPDADALANALRETENVGFSKTENGLVLTGGALDLGAVGKGLAADVLSELYADADGALISVGGSIAAVGTKNGAPWRVGVRDPFGDGDAILGCLYLSDLAVSTSGNYEKTREHEGERYHHILDAQTGLPAESGLVSVTVVAEDGALTDMLATAGFIVGLDACFALCEEYGARVIAVTEEGEVYASSSLADAFEARTGVTVTFR